MVFEPPLELFSLERKGRPVAGRPFRLILSLRSNPPKIFAQLRALLLLLHSARRASPASASFRVADAINNPRNFLERRSLKPVASRSPPYLGACGSLTASGAATRIGSRTARYRINALRVHRVERFRAKRQKQKLQAESLAGGFPCLGLASMSYAFLSQRFTSSSISLREAISNRWVIRSSARFSPSGRRWSSSP